MSQAFKKILSLFQRFLSVEFLAVTILAIILLTPTWVYIIKSGTQDEIVSLKQSAKIAVFLNIETKPVTAQKVQKIVADLNGVTHVTYVSSEAALNTFKSQLGFGDRLDFLGDGILPITFFVETKQKLSAAILDKLIAEIKAIRHVDSVVLDSYWSGKLDVFLHTIERLFAFIGWCFVAVFIAIVFFVTKVLLGTVLNEIKLRLLLGSTYQKISAHYVIQSLYLGAISGLICLIITWSGILWLNEPMASFLHQFGVGVKLSMLNIQASFVLVLLSALMYALTAWITCGFVLYQIDSNLEQIDKF